MADVAKIAIAVQVKDIRRRFRDIEEGAKSRTEEATRIGVGLTKASSRFDQWCANLGAHRDDGLSLEERLRDASRLRRLVSECLDGVRMALEDIRAVTSASSNRIEAAKVDSRGTSEDAALETILSNMKVGDPSSHIDAMIATLVRVAATIRPAGSIAAASDRLKQSQKYRLPQYQEDSFLQLDRRELELEYPKMNPKLRSRLLATSLRRRCLLQYAQDRRDKFALGLALDAAAAQADGDNAAEPDWNLEGPSTDETGSNIVSQYAQSMSASALYKASSSGPYSESGSLMTTMSSTERKFSYPPYTSENYEDDFRVCYACLLFIEAPTKKIWRRHHLDDLRPYVCTLADCPSAETMYVNKKTWFEHELACRSRQWVCPFDNKVFQHRSMLEQHLYKRHPNHSVDGSWDKLHSGGELPSNATNQCPFCDKALTLREMESHVGRHQEKWALVALTSMRDFGGSEDEDEGEDQGEHDNTDAAKDEHPVGDKRERALQARFSKDDHDIKLVSSKRWFFWPQGSHRLFLGQILLQATNPSTAVLPVNESDSEPGTLPKHRLITSESTVSAVMSGPWSYASSEQSTGVFGSRSKEVCFECEELKTQLWRPSLMEIEAILNSVAIYGYRRLPGTIYLVVGVKIAFDLTHAVANHPGEDVQGSFAQPMVIAYALKRIRRSWLGNTVHENYTRGAAF